MSEGTLLPGGIWRRIGAAAIDFLLIFVVFHALALGAYAVSGGQVRMASNFLHFDGECYGDQGLVGNNDSRPLMPHVSHTQTCHKYLLGAEYNRFKTLQAPDGSQQTYPVDVHDHRIAPVNVSALKGVVLILVLALCEWRLGVTPGKALLGLRTTDREGNPLPLPQALLRNLCLWGGWTALYAVNMIEPWITAQSGWLTVAAFAMCLIAMITPWLDLIRSRPDPFYDRLSGARVLQLRNPAQNPDQRAASATP